MTSVLVNILPKITVEPLSSPMVTYSQEYAEGHHTEEWQIEHVNQFPDIN